MNDFDDCEWAALLARLEGEPGSPDKAKAVAELQGAWQLYRALELLLSQRNVVAFEQTDDGRSVVAMHDIDDRIAYQIVRADTLVGAVLSAAQVH